jgi:murein L,D-transpeptidase YafK/thioredoxin-like negative regulator of GroEL
MIGKFLTQMTLIKRFVLRLFLLTIVIAPAYSPGGAISETDYYRQAIQARDRGDLTQAAALLRRTLQKTPAHAEARFQLGVILVTLKRWREAEDEFKRFVQVHPDSVEAHNYLVTIYAQLGMSDSFARELKTVVRLKPDSTQVHTNLADYYLSQAMRSLWRAYKNAPAGQRPTLGHRIDQIAAANQDIAEGYFIRGSMMRLKGDPQARQFFEEAGKLASDFQPARLLEEARRLFQDGEPDEALDNLLALSTLGELTPEAELLTAEILIGQKQYQEALQHLEKTPTQDTSNFKYCMSMATALIGSGESTKAVPYLERALALQEGPELRRQLAEAYKANGDYTRALAEYEKLLKSESDPTQVRREIMEVTRQKLRVAETTNGAHAASGSVATGPVRVPDSLMMLPAGSRFAVVEKETQTLLVFQSTSTGFELEKTFACSTGAREGEKSEKGDEKTPEGIYLFRKILPGSQLPGIYGKMAITLDYPNAYDRLEGKSGDGIWVHASNETIRPYLPNKTRGCVVISNDDIEELAKLITLNQTPLVIVSKIHFQTPAERDEDVATLKSFLSEWRQSWENKLLDPYVALYSKRFRNGDQDLKAFRKYKESVFSRAGRIHLGIELQSIVRHDKYLVLTFRQDYSSQRLTSKGMKRLFAVHEDGAWKIIAEVMRDST